MLPDETMDDLMKRMEPGAQGHDTKAWFDEARNKVKTPAQLAEFVTKLLALPHDYGSIADAVTAAALAAFWTVNADEKSGGITGFQASWAAGQFYRRLLGIEGPFQVVTFSDMLRPSGERHFTRTIKPSVFKWLQEQAKMRLEVDGGHDEARAHWQSIVDGAVPFGFKISDGE